MRRVAAFVLLLLAAAAIYFATQNHGGGAADPSQIAAPERRDAESAGVSADASGKASVTEREAANDASRQRGTGRGAKASRIEVRGRVFDAVSKKPVASARVSYRRVSFSAPVPTVTAETDADGRFLLRLGEFREGWVEVERESFLAGRRFLEQRDVGDEGRAEDYDFALYRLADCGRITGRVASSDAAELVAAKLLYGEVDDPSRKPEDGSVWLRSFDIARDGSFDLTPLRPGRYRLEASAKGYDNASVASLSVGRAQVVDAGRLVLKRSVKSQAPPAAYLFGRVLDARGKGIAEASVVCAGVTGLEAAESASDGRYELRLPPGKSRQIRFEIEGEAGFSFVRAFEAGERVRFDYRVPATEHWIAGRVVDEGVAVAGLSVEVLQRVPGPAKSKSGSRSRSAQTDERGRFRVDGLAEGVADVHLEWYSGAAYRDLLVRSLALDREHVLRFPRPKQVEIHGVVRRRDGSAVGGVLIAPAFGRAARNAAARAKTADNGAFSLRVPLTSQSAVALEASKTGFKGTQRRFLLQEVDASRRIEWNPILHRDDELGRISGALIDSKGKPVAGARCRFERVDHPGLGARVSTTSDSKGRYESAPLVPGSWRVRFLHKAHLSAERRGRVAAGGTLRLDAELTRVERKRFVVEFVDETGSAVGAVRFHALGLGADAIAHGPVDATGRVKLENWPATTTKISAFSNPRFAQQSRIVDFATAEAARIVLRGGKARVFGRVLSPSGHPVVQEIVTLREPEGRAGQIYEEVFTDQNGAFSFDRLPLSGYELLVANSPKSLRRVRPSKKAIELRFPPK